VIMCMLAGIRLAPIPSVVWALVLAVLIAVHGALAHLRARAASASACQLYVLARFQCF
jgi:hypothetical protein